MFHVKLSVAVIDRVQTYKWVHSVYFWSGDSGAGREHRRLAENGRLLILPGVWVRNLALRTLGFAAARLPADWEAAHGVSPVVCR